jgi:hypothetical protein
LDDEQRANYFASYMGRMQQGGVYQPLMGREQEQRSAMAPQGIPTSAMV